MSKSDWIKIGLVVAVLVALGAVAGALFLYAIRVEREPETALAFVVHPAEEAEASRDQYAPFIAYLKRELGREIDLFVAADYAAAVQAMIYGWADLGVINPVGYVIAKQEGADIELIAAGIRKKTGSQYYQALIVVRADSGIADLNGKTFAFVDPMSTSGGLIPSLYIKENNIELGEVFYAGSHPSVILAVKNGTVDAGSIADNRYYTAIEDGIIAEDEFKVLWESELVPSNPVVVQASLSEDLKSRLQKAFLDAPRDIIEHCAVGEIGYARVQDSDYDINRRLVEMSKE